MELHAENEGQKYGLELRHLDDIEKAYRTADKLEERLFVRLSDGSVIEVIRAINSAIQPIVVGVKYKDENDSGEEVKLNVLDDFLRLNPVVVDQDTMFERQTD